MKKTIFIILGSLIVAFVMRTDSNALDLSSIIVYPVPLNPYHYPLKIEDRQGLLKALVLEVKIEIFDINGDSVFSRKYLGLDLQANPIQWNGRNNSGKTVKPGLYIIKITAEDNLTGATGQRIIRILVKY